VLFDSVNLFAMVFRIMVFGISWKSPVAGVSTAEAAAEAGLAGCADAAGAATGLYSRTSAAITRPLYPVPGTDAMLMDFSDANFFASGEAKTRPPELEDAETDALGAAEGVGAAAAAGADGAGADAAAS
jgi:hypothetical protein